MSSPKRVDFFQKRCNWSPFMHVTSHVLYKRLVLVPGPSVLSSSDALSPLSVRRRLRSFQGVQTRDFSPAGHPVNFRGSKMSATENDVVLTLSELSSLLLSSLGCLCSLSLTASLFSALESSAGDIVSSLFGDDILWLAKCIPS